MHANKINIKNQVYICCFDSLVKAKKKKKIGTKNILINEKHYKGLVIYFSRYDHGKTITMLNLY